MRITQGAFSFLPDLTDEEITAQIRYALAQGWSVSVEHTDDPHPRNTYWEMWGQPIFDLDPDQADVGLEQVRACRTAHPDSYVKVIAYDPAPLRQTTAVRFMVGRPAFEPGYRLDREEKRDRQTSYTLHPYATDRPAGERYGRESDNGGEPR
jgi:ribulose-bisphosphate carboxylase small chain